MDLLCKTNGIDVDILHDEKVLSNKVCFWSLLGLHCTTVPEKLRSKGRKNRFPKSIEEDVSSSFASTLREFERISPSPSCTSLEHINIASDLHSNFFRSKTSSEVTGRSHLSEPEPSLDDNMIHDLLEFVKTKK